MIWLVLVAALLAWKGSLYSEAVVIRRLLGMPEPAATHFWWIGAGCIVALVIVWSVHTRLRRRRPGGGAGLK